MTVTTTFDFNGLNDAQNIPLDPITGAAAITSLANGGVAAIGDHAGTIFGAIYNAAGKQTATWTPNLGTNGSLDQLSNGNLVMTSENAGSVLVKVVNSVTGADIAGPITLSHEIGTSNADVVALSGGGFWVVSQTQFSATDNDINFDIFDSNGVLVNSSVLDVSLANDRDAAVTQLDGGNVVVSWTRTVGASTEVWYSILTAAGATVKGPTLFDTYGIQNKHVDVTAINGGGFALVYQDSEWSTNHSNTTLAKFSADGTSTGKFNLSATSAGSVEPSVTRLANGLLAVTEVRGDLTFVSLVNPANGQVLAVRDVIGDFAGRDPHDAVVAALGTSRIAVFYNDPVVGLSGGSALTIVRTSISDSIAFAGDTINGDGFIDKIFGGNGDDTLNGAGGDDEIKGGFGVDTINGGDGNDFIEGGQGYDFIHGGAGNDLIFVMTAGEAETSISNGETNGDDGDDRIVGSAAAELLSGDAGDDTLDGRSNSDTLDGGAGNDTASYAEATSAVTATLTDSIAGHTGGSSAGGGGSDTLIDIENLTGSRFADTLTGNNGSNVLDGGRGADTLSGLAGNDKYIVGSPSDVVLEAVGGGIDRVLASVSYALAANQEIEVLSTNNNQANSAINLTGNNLANKLIGNAGANVLAGGLGNDVLTGLAGADTFLFNTALSPANIDTIKDFRVGVDKIQLAVAVFTALGAGPALAAAAFNTGAAATQFNDRIIYNPATGALIYDADGLNGAAGVQFATLSAGLALSASDFLVL